MTIWIWDPAKDEANRKNHNGLPLAAGIPVLNDDEWQITQPDPHPGGDRFRTVGSPDGGVTVLFVVSTEPIADDDGEWIDRIISVRKATPAERRTYEQQPRDT